MKILAIIPTGFCFGLQHITVDFFSRFPEHIQSHFMLTKFGNGEMETLLRKKNIDFSYSWFGMFSRKLDRLNIKMSLHSLSKLPRLYYDFFKTRKSFKPDIIYFANHHELILLSPALQFCKEKIVCHMHDPAPAIAFQKKTFSFYGRYVDKFIAISESVRNRTIQLGCKSSKIETIYNGIKIQDDVKSRTDLFIKNTNWPNDVCVIGITGQMTATKGGNDVLNAFIKLHQKAPHTRLVIGGKFLEPMYSQLKFDVEKAGLNALVYFPGWLENSNDFFNAIDIFVLASRHDEGFGLVVAEAMERARPVVSTNSGGAVEIIEDGVTGFIVEKNNPNQIMAKLELLSNDLELRKKMGDAGRERIKNQFNIDKQVVKLLNAFENVTA